jgi:hypothetical protein
MKRKRDGEGGPPYLHVYMYIAFSVRFVHCKFLMITNIEDVSDDI